MFMPRIVWSDLLRGYFNRITGNTEYALTVQYDIMINTWISKYGGPRTGLCLNILANRYHGRDVISLAQIGEGIFRKWKSEPGGRPTTDNGVEDELYQFCWYCIDPAR